MKRKAIPVAASVLGLLLVISTARGAKPQNVIDLSNGYPSGEHWNLNIHGKDPDKFDPDPTATGGNSVFVALYGDSTITFRSDKKSGLTELNALDPYAEAFDNDPVLVQIPYEADGCYVFARIKGKPDNGSNGDASSVILTPNTVPRVSDYVEDPNDPSSLLLLGVVTTNGVYEMTSAGLSRFDSDSKGKGKGKAIDITGLFLWTGWVVDATLDTSGPDGTPDGVIDEYDVPPEYDLDGNGIDAAELEAWLTDQADLGLATFYMDEWIFNIGDVVEQDQTLTNDGTTLLKLRFYPVDTTTFVR